MNRYLPLAIALVILPAWRHADAVPDEVTRVLRTFDFEERRLGNAEDLPMHWSKVEGPGRPHYVNGRLSTDAAKSGKYSFRLDLNGGSVGYRFSPTTIRVSAGAHYRVEAMVRTTVLPNAKARLSTVLADADGHLLVNTLRHAEPFASTAADEGWHKLSVELSADDPRAAFVTIELGLLQPALYAAATLGGRQLDAQDINGTAWFDDVTISQTPRLTLATVRPANVFRRGEPVRVEARVDDRSTDDLTSTVTVADADGTVVHRRTSAADLAAADRAGPGQKKMWVDVPELPAGLYRVTIELSARGQRLCDRSLPVVQLADANPPEVPDGRFGYIATGVPFDGWGELPRVLPMLSAGRVKLALWTRDGDIADQSPGQFESLVESLRDLQIVPTACLLDLPPAAMKEAVTASNQTDATGRRRTTWASLPSADPKIWQPRLADLLSRHANHLSRWQIGEDGTDAFVADPAARRAYADVYAQFAKMIRRPNLAVPWPAWYEPDGSAPSAVALSVPALAVLPNQIPLYLNDTSPAGVDVRSPRMDDLSVSLAWLAPEAYGRRVRLRDLAQRIVYTLSAGATQIDLPLPMNVRREGDVTVSEPAEELIVLRTIVGTLSGAAYQGRVPIAEGVEAFLFDRGGKGVLALWDRGSAAGVRDLAINLGHDPVRVDLWGNRTPLPRLKGAGGKVSLTVSRTPVFITDVDGELMRTRASVAFDRPLIESSFQPHLRKLRFTNAYRAPVSGSVRLTPPAGWELTPVSIPFTLAPGETFERDVTIRLPYNATAGPKTIDAAFSLQVEGNASFTVPIAVTVGLSDVGMRTMAMRVDQDVVVQQTVTNYGDKPVSYAAFAVLPGQARQERIITALAPGASTVKRYRFAAGEFKGGTVRVGMKEAEGTRILNEEVEVR